MGDAVEETLSEPETDTEATAEEGRPEAAVEAEILPVASPEPELGVITATDVGEDRENAEDDERPANTDAEASRPSDDEGTRPIG